MNLKYTKSQMKFQTASRKFIKCLKKNFGEISIHGLRSIFHSTSKFGILFWIVIFLTGVTYCCMLLNENIIEFNYQRVLRTIDTTAYPIFQVPFPAVTLCNFNFVYKPRYKRIENMLIKNGVTTNDANSFFQNLALLKTPDYIDTTPYRKIYRILEQNGYDTLRLMQEIAQPCENLLKYCTWAGVQVNCSKLFREAKADMGLCCSFNYQILSSLKEREKYDQEYFTGSGPLLGLYVLLDTEKAQTVSSVYNNTGIYAYVHDKVEYPSETSFFSLIQPGKEIAMKIIPTITESEPELRSFRIQSRQCLFDEEGSTFWSTKYCFQNCIQLCKLRAISKICKCVPHYFPNLGRFNACTLLDVPCLKKNENIFGAITIQMIVNKNNRNNSIVCDCLPECSSIKYTGFTESVFYKNMTGIQEENSAIRVYFQNDWCMKYKMIRYIENNAFIAVIGGLFSLCLGGSILSLIELVSSAIKTVISFLKKDENEIDKKYPQLYWAEIFKKEPTKKVTIYNYHAYYDNFVN